jgi:large repetitive protein
MPRITGKFQLLTVFSILLCGSVLPLRAGILSLTSENSVVNTLAGNGYAGSRNGIHRDSLFYRPTDIVTDRHGNLYVADFNNNQIRVISRNGVVTTFAGTGMPGHADGTGREAMFHGPHSIAMDVQGNVIVTDANNFCIRKITPEGLVTTVAGNRFPGYLDGTGEYALFVYPTGITVGRNGNIYVADRDSHTIRKITPDGMVTTLAGTGEAGYQDGPGVESKLHDPITLAQDSMGNLYVADAGNHSIRKITVKGQVSTFAGRPLPGFKDGRTAKALFHRPMGLAFDDDDNLYVSDSNNSRIRRITPDGVVTTLAGTGAPGYVNGPGNIARFDFPTGLGVDRNGNLYVADSGNHLIRTITPGQTQFVQENGRNHDHG